MASVIKKITLSFEALAKYLYLSENIEIAAVQQTEFCGVIVTIVDPKGEIPDSAEFRDGSWYAIEDKGATRGGEEPQLESST